MARLPRTHARLSPLLPLLLLLLLALLAAACRAQAATVTSRSVRRLLQQQQRQQETKKRRATIGGLPRPPANAEADAPPPPSILRLEANGETAEARFDAEAAICLVRGCLRQAWPEAEADEEGGRPGQEACAGATSGAAPPRPPRRRCLSVAPGDAFRLVAWQGPAEAVVVVAPDAASALLEADAVVV